MIAFRIPEMTCGHCASTISRAIATVDQGARTNVNIPGKLVRVTSTAPVAKLVQAIQVAGYSAEELQPEPARPSQATAGGGCCCSSRKTQPLL